MNGNNASGILMTAMYFSGLIWVGWRLYHTPTPDPSRQTPVANRESNNLPGRPTAITVVCVIMALVVAYDTISLIINLVQFGSGAWLVNLVLLIVGVCSIIGLWTMNKWGA